MKTIIQKKFQKKILPVKLPEIDKLEETGNPLDKNSEWKNITIDGKKYTRETDTLDTFVCSYLVFFKILFSSKRKI
jgi:Leucyl-tRNA synthetase